MLSRQPCRQDTSPGSGIAASAAEKGAHRLDHGLGLFEMRQVAGLVDQLDLRAGDALGELLRIGRRDDAVGLAPDDQRRRRDAVNAVLEAAVGDRPDELAGAGLRPDELRQRVDARVRIARDVEEALAPPRPSGSANSERRRALSLSSIQFLTGRSSRHSPTGSISTSRPTDFGAAAANSAATSPPNEWPTSDRRVELRACRTVRRDRRPGRASCRARAPRRDRRGWCPGMRGA